MQNDPTAEASQNHRRAFLLGALPIAGAIALLIGAAMLYERPSPDATEPTSAPILDLDREGGARPVVRGDRNRPDAQASGTEAVLGGEDPTAVEQKKARLLSNPLLQGLGEPGVGEPAALDLADDRAGALTADPAGTRSKSTEIAAQDIQALAPVGSSAGATEMASPNPLELAGAGGAVVAIREPAPPLTDAEAVRQHIQETLAARIPTLRACYEQRLKARESLEGDWRLEFVVAPDGKVGQVQVSGQEMKDAEFEACLLRQIERWSFRQIGAAQPVGRSVTFQSVP